MLCVMSNEQEQTNWQEWLGVTNNLLGLLALMGLIVSVLLFLGQHPVLALAAFCLSVPCILFFLSGWIFKNNNSPLISLSAHINSEPKTLEEKMRPEIDRAALLPKRELQPIALKSTVQENQVSRSTETVAKQINETVTPDYLMSLYDEFTATQANKLVKPYIGTWIKASGNIASVTLKPDGIQIFIRQLPNPNRMLCAYFPGIHAVKQYENLGNSGVITLFGQVQDVNKRAVLLDNCEFAVADSVTA